MEGVQTQDVFRMEDFAVFGFPDNLISCIFLYEVWLGYSWCYRCYFDTSTLVISGNISILFDSLMPMSCAPGWIRAKHKTTSTFPYSNLCVTCAMSMMETPKHPDFPAKSLDLSSTATLGSYLENCTLGQSAQTDAWRRNQLSRKK